MSERLNLKVYSEDLSSTYTRFSTITTCPETVAEMALVDPAIGVTVITVPSAGIIKPGGIVISTFPSLYIGLEMTNSIFSWDVVWT